MAVLRLLAVLVFVSLVSAAHHTHAQSCVNASTSAYFDTYCGTYVVPGVPYSSVYVPAGKTMTDLDTAFINTGILVPPQDCLTSGFYFICSGIYQNCTSTSPPTGLPVCRSMCFNFTDDCGPFVQGLPQNYQDIYNSNKPNCNGNDPSTNLPYPSSNCDDLYAYFAAANQSTGGNANINVTCPEPLIPNPGFNMSDGYPHNCAGACCIPCPLTPALYPIGRINSVNTMGDVLGVISFVLVFITAISYVVLPHKRGYPSHIILNLSIALFLFYVTVFFNFGPTGRLLLQCENYPANPVDLALPGYTQNHWTKAQGVFVVYGILSAVVWYGFLVLNIFLSVVFLNTRMGDYPIVYHVINWFLPWIAIIIVLACNQIGYLGLGTYVTMNNGWWMNGIFMIPIAVVVFPSVILNGITLAKITLIGLRRNATYRQILRLQLRPFLFVLVVLFIFLVYWIHYETALNVTPSQDFVPAWVQCLVSGKGQDQCYYEVAAPHLPSFPPYVFAELVVNCLGFVIFCFFVLRKDVIFGWYYFTVEGYDASFFNLSYVSGARSNGETTSRRGQTATSKASIASRSTSALPMDELQAAQTTDNLKPQSPVGAVIDDEDAIEA